MDTTKENLNLYDITNDGIYLGEGIILSPNSMTFRGRLADYFPTKIRQIPNITDTIVENLFLNAKNDCPAILELLQLGEGWLIPSIKDWEHIEKHMKILYKKHREYAIDFSWFWTSSISFSRLNIEISNGDYGIQRYSTNKINDDLHIRPIKKIF